MSLNMTCVISKPFLMIRSTTFSLFEFKKDAKEATIEASPEQNHYWECWLYYTKATDKTKSTRERIIQARKEFPCIWTSYSNGVEKTTCYWDIILKSKYCDDPRKYNRDQKLKKLGI